MRECEWCGEVHEVTKLCRKEFSRRSFTSLLGLGLLGLGLGPYSFDKRAPMLGPRVEALDTSGNVLSSVRLEQGKLKYLMFKNEGSNPVYVHSGRVRGTGELDFTERVNTNLSEDCNVTFTFQDLYQYGSYYEGNISMSSASLLLPGGLYNTKAEIKERLLAGHLPNFEVYSLEY